MNSLKKVEQTVVGWAHTHGGEVPSFVRAEVVASVESCWEFWNAVNEYVKASGTFRTLKFLNTPPSHFISRLRVAWMESRSKVLF